MINLLLEYNEPKDMKSSEINSEIEEIVKSKSEGVYSKWRIGGAKITLKPNGKGVCSALFLNGFLIQKHM